MTKLNELLTSHHRLFTDRLKMLADADRAKETEARILADGQITDSEVRALTDARTLRELIARRLPDTDVMLKKTDGLIYGELLRLARVWNRTVRTAVEMKQAEIEAALRPFFEGAKRECRKTVEGIACSAIYHLRRAGFELASGTAPGFDFYAINARQFLDHTARNARRFGLTLPE